jgi:glycine cleavage system H protein
MNFPRELWYTKDHEWARVADRTAVVGITDFAQDRLGSIVFVDFPALGKSFKKGDTLISVDSVKAVAEVYSPVTGEVQAVNDTLRDKPELVNQDPYGEGWMVKLKIAEPGELGALMTVDAYEALVAREEAKG